MSDWLPRIQTASFVDRELSRRGTVRETGTRQTLDQMEDRLAGILSSLREGNTEEAYLQTTRAHAFVLALKEHDEQRNKGIV